MTNKILDDFKGDNDHAFGWLYKEYFPMVERFVRQNSGRLEDAEDVFQDTMLVLVEKLRKDNFQLTASIKTYIMAIAKNLWLKRLRTAYREVEFSELHENSFFDEINLTIEQEKTYWDRLQSYVQKISDHCKGLIDDMFFKGKQIDQIQREYGYSTRHNAQNQKHKCVEQIRRIKEEDEKHH